MFLTPNILANADHASRLSSSLAAVKADMVWKILMLMFCSAQSEANYTVLVRLLVTIA